MKNILCLIMLSGFVIKSYGQFPVHVDSLYTGANQIVAQNLHKNQHAHIVAVPEERYLCRIPTPRVCVPEERYPGYLDIVPPERISVFSLFFYKDTVPPGRLRAV